MNKLIRKFSANFSRRSSEALFVLQIEEKDCEGAHAETNPLTRDQAFAENDDRGKRCYDEAAYGNSRIDEAWGERRGSKQNDKEIHHSASRSRHNGKIPRFFECGAIVRFVLAQAEKKGDDNGKCSSKKHHHTAVLSVKCHLLIALQDRAKGVARQKHSHAKKPFDRKLCFCLSVLLAEKAKRKGNGDQRHSRNGGPCHRLIPEDKAPDGNGDKG